MRAQHPRRSAHPRIFRINSPDARARHNIKRTQRNAPYHAELRTGVSAMPTFMHNGPGVRKRSHQTCTAAHDKHTAQDSTNHAPWPRARHCSVQHHAALKNDDKPGPNTSLRPRSPASSGRSRTGVGRTQPAYTRWRKARSACQSWQSGRDSRERYERAGTVGHHLDQASPARSSKAARSGGWASSCAGGAWSRSVPPADKGAAG